MPTEPTANRGGREPTRTPNPNDEDRRAAAQQAEATRAAAERRANVSRLMDPAAYGLPAGTVTDPQAISEAFVRLHSAGVNLLAPETRIDFIPPGYAISLRFCYFDPFWPVPDMATKSNGYWYEQKGGGVSLHYISLNQLASLAGLTWLHSDRADDGRTPLIWRFNCRARVRYYDGTTREESGNGECDLRDGSAEIAGMKDATIQRMRAKGSQRCESIAKAGLIRKLLAVRQKYTIEEAQQPFVWPALVYMMPTDDPVINRMIAAKELGLTADLFGPPAPQARVIEAHAEPVEAASRPTPRALPAPQADPPDFRAENARLAARQPTPRQTAAVEESLPWDDEPEGKPAFVPACFECGVTLTDAQAEKSDGLIGRMMCDAHAAAAWQRLTRAEQTTRKAQAGR